MASMTPTDLGLTLAFSVIVLTNLLGNGVVCLVALRFLSGMRAPINYLLVNLAVSDMLVALSIAPQYIFKWTFDHPNGTAGDYMCKLLTGGNFLWVGQAASTFSLVAVAFERYLAVVQPLDNRWRLTSRRLIAVIIAGWIYALIFDLPLFFVVRREDGVDHCVEQWSNTNLAKAYTMGCFFIFGAIPVSAMICLYSRILCNLWKCGMHATLICEQGRVRARVKVTKMVLVVSAVYAGCRLPNLILYMLSYFRPELYAYGSKSYVTSVLLVGVNSAMNPFIYALHSTNFRRHTRNALCCKTSRSVDFSGAR